MLRAIAFELNMGYSFEETLMDLNICKEGTPKYKIRFEFADGTFMEHPGERINTYSSDMYYLWVYPKNRKNGREDAIRFDFIPSDIVFDMNDYSDVNPLNTTTSKGSTEAQFNVLDITSSCCALVSLLNLTAYPDTRIVSCGYFSGCS